MGHSFIVIFAFLTVIRLNASTRKKKVAVPFPQLPGKKIIFNDSFFLFLMFDPTFNFFA